MTHQASYRPHTSPPETPSGLVFWVPLRSVSKAKGCGLGASPSVAGGSGQGVRGGLRQPNRLDRRPWLLTPIQWPKWSQRRGKTRGRGVGKDSVWWTYRLLPFALAGLTGNRGKSA
jgi:hypothetical protein